MRAFVGLGGNLGDVISRLRRAVSALDALPCTRVTSVSSVYRNPPMGSRPQPYYLNAVAEVCTGLTPRALLRHLQDIERSQGRTRGSVRWQARTLDLDLLLFGDLRTEDGVLTVPHPGVHLRPFVIHPLAEIAPDVLVPGHGRCAALAARVSALGLERLGQEIGIDA